MEIAKILKRKDASSVVVAVILAFFLSNAIETWSIRPAGWLSADNAPGHFWNDGLWQPFIYLVIELVILEIVVRILAAVSRSVGKK